MEKDNLEQGMTYRQCIELIRKLSYSQGYYGRLYNFLKNLEDDDPEYFKQVKQAFETENFKSPLDLIMYLEC